MPWKVLRLSLQETAQTFQISWSLGARVLIEKLKIGNRKLQMI
jgi:hypothetical protein